MLLKAIIGGGAAALLITAASFSACSGVTRERPSDLAASSNVAHERPASMPSKIASGPEPVDAGAADAESVAMASRDCQDPQAIILNHPDGGVVFNNAMTSVDAGFIDRSQGVIDTIAKQAKGYRCCFDAWVRDHEDAETKLLLRLTLAAGGEVLDAEVDPHRSSKLDDATRNCIVQLARDSAYPVSPTGKQTVVEYPFRVGALSP